MSTNGESATTEPKQKGDSRQLSWNENLRIKLKEGEKVNLSILDKDDKNATICSYDAFPKEFKNLAGSKKFNVIDNNYDPLGTLEINFETQNFVSK